MSVSKGLFKCYLLMKRSNNRDDKFIYYIAAWNTPIRSQDMALDSVYQTHNRDDIISKHNIELAINVAAVNLYVTLLAKSK